MCGILGGITPGMSREDRIEFLWRALLNTQTRGKDATGVAWHTEDGTPVVFKAGEAADKFVGSPIFDQIEKDLPITFVGHCRASTQGSEADNVNNHPVVSKQTGLVLIHNGVVRDEAWRQTDPDGSHPFRFAEPDGQVDTEIIMRLIETLAYIPREEDGTISEDTVRALGGAANWGERKVSWMKAIDDALFNLEGSNACALMVPEEPNVLYLWRHSSPLFLAYVPEFKSLFFTSTEQIFKDSISRTRTEKVLDLFERKVDDTPEYYGADIKDKTLIRVEYTGDEKTPFDIKKLELEPPDYYPTRRSGGGTTTTTTPAKGKAKMKENRHMFE